MGSGSMATRVSELVLACRRLRPMALFQLAKSSEPSALKNAVALSGPAIQAGAAPLAQSQIPIWLPPLTTSQRPLGEKVAEENRMSAWSVNSRQQVDRSKVQHCTAAS